MVMKEPATVPQQSVVFHTLGDRFAQLQHDLVGRVEMIVDIVDS